MYDLSTWILLLIPYQKFNNFASRQHISKDILNKIQYTIRGIVTDVRYIRINIFTNMHVCIVVQSNISARTFSITSTSLAQMSSSMSYIIMDMNLISNISA